ncbi:MAG: ABC transporter permease, partial [Firmicutes bacterium]|nr:ABC transporter permease [Bacillota bacterium]
GKMQQDNLANNFPGVDGIDWLVSSWIMAGIITVSTVTVPLSAIGTLINDRTTGVLNDFYTSPVNRNLLALSYLISAWFIAFVMVFFNFIIGQVYVLSTGGELLGFIPTIKMIGAILISIMSFSSLFFYIALFMKTANSFSTLATIMGTFVGFLGGIYIPIGVLGKNVQAVMNLLPTAHSVTLIRNIYMEGAIEKVFANAPQEAFDNYSYIYGLEVNIGDYTMSPLLLIISMLVFGAVFYVLSVMKLSKSKL